MAQGFDGAAASLGSVTRESSQGAYDVTSHRTIAVERCASRWKAAATGAFRTARWAHAFSKSASSAAVNGFHSPWGFLLASAGGLQPSNSLGTAVMRNPGAIAPRVFALGPLRSTASMIAAAVALAEYPRQARISLRAASLSQPNGHHRRMMRCTCDTSA